ncbi:MAG: serine hydrolase domain-containing protein [Maribacter sp.]
MKNRTVIFLVVGLLGIMGFAQIPSNFEKNVDSIYKAWDTIDKPGGAAAIIKDGKVVYLKGFGVASLETNELITPQTKFQLGEMSKLFTSLAILLLEEQEKISLGDDIRKYLPELPKYKHTVTVGHLLNHSSGLYNINKIHTVINGSGEVTTQAEALKLVASQKALSFKPGTEFSFHESVTESVLMAEIVAKSSGQSFADYVKINIFEPLGMKNTIIRDDSNAILVNVAEPYQKEEDEDYKKLEIGSSVVGAINAYSSAEDLAKWYLNYSHPKGNLGRLIQRLDSPVQLSNGKKFVYYWGEMAIGREFTHPERGLPIFWNFGLQGGYGTNVFRYLNQNITSFALGNSNQYNGALAQGAIGSLVKDLYPLPENIDFKAKKIKKLSTKKLKAFEGNYWFKEGYASQLFVENDTLRSKWLFARGHQTLVPLSDDTFQQYAEMDATRLFKFKKESDDMEISFTFNESRPDIMRRYKPVEPSAQALQSYEGTYFNKEYATLFSFRLEDGQLIASNLNHQDITLRPVIKDVFTSTSMFFNALEFLKDDLSGIKGFTMVTDGIKNLVFDKVQ